MEELEEQNAELATEMERLKEAMSLLEARHAKTNELLEERDSVYKAHWETEKEISAAFRAKVSRKINRDAHMRYMDHGSHGNFIVPVALWLNKSHFDVVYKDGLWRKVRDDAQKKLEDWYCRMRPSEGAPNDECSDEYEVEGVEEPPSDEDSRLWSQELERVAPTRNKARRGSQ